MFPDGVVLDPDARQRALPVDAGRGRVTTNVDLLAPAWSLYTASKAAYEVWLRCVAPELRHAGVAAPVRRAVVGASGAAGAGAWPEATARVWETVLRLGVMADDDRDLLTTLGAVNLCGAAAYLLNPRMGTDNIADWRTAWTRGPSARCSAGGARWLSTTTAPPRRRRPR
ncbi:MAG: hypothetical protein FWF28_11195 [Micrococcales bacterium]|nr:hypothetical protein [Micrococcales bacterium]